MANKSLALETTADEEAQYKAQIDECLAEMKRLNAEMVAEQAGMDALRAESRLLASDTRTMMNEIWATIARIEAV